MTKETIQKAGDNSCQTQVQNLTINYGITEERARQICFDISQKAIAENTAFASEELTKRLQKLENIIIPRIQEFDKNFEIFADPAFQVLLKKAQLTAACTENDVNYHILSELLVHRIRNKTNVKKNASISKAVEIIDKIDDDSLCALTLYHSIASYIPISGNISNGIKVLSDLYECINLDDLPKNDEWIDNLSILGVAYIIPFSSLNKFYSILENGLDGYVCIGIQKNSDEYKKALEKLSEIRINPNILIDNELLDGYVRLAIPQKKSIEELKSVQLVPLNGCSLSIQTDISQKQKEGLFSIFDDYVQEANLINIVKKNFHDMLQSFIPIKKAMLWWDSININFRINSIGRVIAHANAKRINPSIPDLD